MVVPVLTSEDSLHPQLAQDRNHAPALLREVAGHTAEVLENLAHRPVILMNGPPPHRG